MFKIKIKNLMIAEKKHLINKIIKLVIKNFSNKKINYNKSLIIPLMLLAIDKIFIYLPQTISSQILFTIMLLL